MADRFKIGQYILYPQDDRFALAQVKVKDVVPETVVVVRWDEFQGEYILASDSITIPLSDPGWIPTKLPLNSDILKFMNFVYNEGLLW